MRERRPYLVPVEQRRVDARRLELLGQLGQLALQLEHEAHELHLGGELPLRLRPIPWQAREPLDQRCGRLLGAIAFADEHQCLFRRCPGSPKRELGSRVCSLRVMEQRQDRIIGGPVM